MSDAWNRAVVAFVATVLRLFRLPLLNSPRIYTVWGAPWIQPLLERLAERRARDVLAHARRTCPAYRRFLQEHAVPVARGAGAFAAIPETTKENYVGVHSIEARCHGGRLPSRGVVIDESSGSSGVPNNWVRGVEERASVARLIRHAFRLRFDDRQMMVLNAFALGPWATGMNVSMSMVDVSILKSIGPDAAKLDNTLALFGPEYEYVIAGYPPFIKDWIDRTSVDLSAYRLHLVCGGEGYSLGLRARFEEVFQTIVSSYGASDLEINIAVETELSTALRRRCADDPALCGALFGREDPPMIFQYHPLDYLIERSTDGELVITILRRGTIAPKIRYNIRDLGGTVRHRDVARVLGERGVDLGTLAPGQPALPLLYLYGRNDLSVPFYGAKVFTTDLDRIIHDTPALRGCFGNFRIEVREEASLAKVLVIALERCAAAGASDPIDALPRIIHERLREVNQDFREVSSLFGPDQIEVEVFERGTGPFADEDVRLKRRYVHLPEQENSRDGEPSREHP